METEFGTAGSSTSFFLPEEFNAKGRASALSTRRTFHGPDIFNYRSGALSHPQASQTLLTQKIDAGFSNYNLD